MQMRAVHRIVSILVVLVTLYLGLTGSLIEMVDFKTIVTKPSPFDPNLMAMREDFAGPPNFRVLGAADHLARSLPAGTDLTRLMRTTADAAVAGAHGAPVKYVELRMAGDRPVGQAKVGKALLRYDPVTGAALGQAPPVLNEEQPPLSLRNTVKHLHRMTTFGDWALWINIIASIALATLIVTGTIIYWRVWQLRRRIKRPNPLWMAGGWWRALHRSTSLVAGLFLIVTTLSGAWLAVESLMFGQFLRHSPQVFAIDPSSPLHPADVPAMMDATLRGYRAAEGDLPPRVVRLRHYGTAVQGVVITSGQEARQLVFDATNGRPLRLTERGYPETGFPFGWQAHQWAKSIHRGDFFGLTGRVTSLLAGLAMTYLSVSGIVMYLTMWKKRRKVRKPALFWK